MKPRQVLALLGFSLFALALSLLAKVIFGF
jgi:hypothetical protein